MDIWCYKGAFPVKVAPGTDFIDGAVVQWCFSGKYTFVVGVGNLQVISNKFRCEYLCTVSEPCFVCSSYFLRSWST